MSFDYESHFPKHLWESDAAYRRRIQKEREAGERFSEKTKGFFEFFDQPVELPGDDTKNHTLTYKGIAITFRLSPRTQRDNLAHILEMFNNLSEKRSAFEHIESKLRQLIDVDPNINFEHYEGELGVKIVKVHHGRRNGYYGTVIGESDD